MTHTSGLQRATPPHLPDQIGAQTRGEGEGAWWLPSQVKDSSPKGRKWQAQG